MGEGAIITVNLCLPAFMYTPWVWLAAYNNTVSPLLFSWMLFQTLTSNDHVFLVAISATATTSTTIL